MSEMTIENDKGECVWRLCYNGGLTNDSMRVLNAMNEYANWIPQDTMRCRNMYETLGDAFYASLDTEPIAYPTNEQKESMVYEVDAIEAARAAAPTMEVMDDE